MQRKLSKLPYAARHAICECIWLRDALIHLPHARDAEEAVCSDRSKICIVGNPIFMQCKVARSLIKSINLLGVWLCQVTSVCWTGNYSDLFTVALGSFDFQKQTAGLVLGFSLKNSSHPEFLLRTKSGKASCTQPLLGPKTCAEGLTLPEARFNHFEAQVSVRQQAADV